MTFTELEETIEMFTLKPPESVFEKELFHLTKRLRELYVAQTFLSPQQPEFLDTLDHLFEPLYTERTER